MPLPKPDQYNQALQSPAFAFADPELKAARVLTTPLGLPKVVSGGFALTYRLDAVRGHWAVRCFHRDVPDLQQRYAAISQFVKADCKGIFAPIDYMPQGVLVDGKRYPITKMPWIAAVPINRYLEENLSSQTATSLESRFARIVRELATDRIAHGDLQHGNVLVTSAGNLKLVDYDGMYVPALHGRASNEAGHGNYQHPLRNDQFGPELDRFSSLVITTALRALADKPSLWTTYSNGDNLLFRQADFLDPAVSPLFRELQTMPTVKSLADRLVRVCGELRQHTRARRLPERIIRDLPHLEACNHADPISNPCVCRMGAPDVARHRGRCRDGGWSSD